MNEYLKAQSKTNELLVGGYLNPDERNRFSTSDYRWAENRSKGLQRRDIKKGEIYQFEFGKNYMPEMSYEHRGLVIGKKSKLLYVLPVYSYDSAKHPDVYHPVDNSGSHSNLYLLKNSEFPFIKHDSVLKLDDIRTISINRILYKHKGLISISSSTYQEIEKLVIQKYFPVFLHDFEKYKSDNSLLKEQHKEDEIKLENIKNENQLLCERIKELEKLLSYEGSEG